MTGAMLVLLAACRLPALNPLVGKKTLAAGPHLKSLIEGWLSVSGEPVSPSVDQSLKIINEVDGFLKEESYSDVEYQPDRTFAGN